MSKQPALLAEDGAKFIGHIQCVEPGIFQATCHAELHRGQDSLVEMPEYHTAESHDGALAWVGEMAARRGFRTWSDTSQRGRPHAPPLL